MLEVINAVVTGVGLVALEALRQRGQKETIGKLQTLREDLEQKLHEHEELRRQVAAGALASACRRCNGQSMRFGDLSPS